MSIPLSGRGASVFTHRIAAITAECVVLFLATRKGVWFYA